MTDKRLWFFLAAAVVCGLMVPLAPSDLRWVPEVTAATYVVLAVLIALDSISRHRRSRR